MTDLLSSLDDARSALVSSCGTYRYTLTRPLPQAAGAPDRMVAWIMLNPSTADAMADDPTIRRVLGFSARWGFTRLAVVNLYALRSTQPEALWVHADPIGPENGRWIDHILADANAVVCAWGAHAKPERVRAVTAAVREAGHRPQCLGTTKLGQPKHPLYIAGNQPLVPWTLDPAAHLEGSPA